MDRPNATDTNDANAEGSPDVMRELPQLTLNGQSVFWLLMSATTVILSVYTLVYAYRPFILKGKFAIMAVLMALVAFFLYQLTEQERDRSLDYLHTALLVGLIGATIVAFGYFFFAYDDLLNRVLQYEQIEYALAGFVVLLALEGTRQSYGVALTSIISVTLLYAYLGPYLIGIFHHEGLGVTRILERSALTFNGAFGFIPKVGTTWVAIFLIYGGLLEAFGARDFFSEVGRITSSRIRSGVAQFAIVTSSLMGMIMGVSAANTATTGSFTIPLMKRNELRGDTAGAIESVASSGGQIMPPVMGASAFVMAAMLGITYAKILKAALLPAVLFYLSLAVVTHIVSLNQGITHNFGNKEDTDLVDGLPIVVSLLVLVYFLVWVQYGPMQSAFYAIVVLVSSQLVWNAGHEANRTKSVVDSAKRTLRGLHTGGMTTARLMPAIVGVGIMVEMIQVGALIQKITFMMLNLTSGQLLPLLFLGMVLSLLLGMGAPTIVAYIVVATMVAPAAVKFGIPQLHGHLFAFYFAVLSAITPPFAVACLVASGISGSNFLKTCWEAAKLALPMYLLPYAFVIHGNLLIWNQMTPLTFVIVLLGMIGTILGVVGYPNRRLSRSIRGTALLAAAAILLTSVPVANAVGALYLFGLLGYLSQVHDRLPSTAVPQ